MNANETCTIAYQAILNQVLTEIQKASEKGHLGIVCTVPHVFENSISEVLEGKGYDITYKQSNATMTIRWDHHWNQ